MKNGSAAFAALASKTIVRQVEHYFGNYNLPRDKFLLEQMKLDDGWIPMETMVKFPAAGQAVYQSGGHRCGAEDLQHRSD